MPDLLPGPSGKSEIEVQPLYRLARVPIHLTRRAARLALAALIAGDVVVIALHLAAALPEVRALAGDARITSLDLGVPANLPWTWGLLKLSAAAALSALMALSYPYDRRADGFWWLACALAALLALAQSASLHGLWVGTVAPALFGGAPDPRLALVSHGGPLLILYLAAAARLPAWSRAGAAAFAASAVLFLAAWLDMPAALTGAWTARVGAETAEAAWHHGLIGLSRSLLLGGLALTLADIQARSVRYVYAGEGG
jgi:hypothetical protein